MPQYSCRRFELKTATYQSPALRGPIRAPFIITLPADSELCKHFEKDTFIATSLMLPERPEIPASIFTDHVLELAGEGKKPAAKKADSEDEKEAEVGPDSIEQLELHKGAIKALKDGGITTISELKEKSDEELEAIRGISTGRLPEIHKAIAAYEADSEDEKEAED